MKDIQTRRLPYASGLRPPRHNQTHLGVGSLPNASAVFSRYLATYEVMSGSSNHSEPSGRATVQRLLTVRLSLTTVVRWFVEVRISSWALLHVVDDRDYSC